MRAKKILLSLSFLTGSGIFLISLLSTNIHIQIQEGSLFGNNFVPAWVVGISMIMIGIGLVTETK